MVHPSVRKGAHDGDQILVNEVVETPQLINFAPKETRGAVVGRVEGLEGEEAAINRYLHT